MRDRRNAWGWFGLAVVATCFALALLRMPDGATDLDALYHLGHAQVYAERGIGVADFPWATASVINVHSADLWHGFHVLLMPVAASHDSVADAVRPATVLLVSLGLLIGAVALRALGTSGWWFWPLLFFGATQQGVWRAMMVRPGVVSGAVLLLIVVAVCRRHPLLAAAAALSFAVVHYTTVWLVVPFVGVVLLCQRLSGEPIAGRAGLAAIGGALVGCLLRPNPWGSLQLLKIQALDVQRLLSHEPPLRFGDEISMPLDMSELWRIGTPFVAVWFIAMLLGARASTLRQGSERQSAFASLCALSIGFFVMTYSVSARIGELWLVTATAVCALGFTYGLPSVNTRLKAVVACGFVLLLSAFSVSSTVRLIDLYGYDTRDFAPVSRWLEANTPEGSIVFHPYWETFTQLFGNSRHNRYIGGMDPTFQFLYDEEKHWIAHWMTTDLYSGEAYTTKLGTSGPHEPLAQSLKQRFGADYLVVPDSRLPRFNMYLSTDPAFKLAFEGADTKVYRLVGHSP